jgi:ribosome-binding protein aMBF1 (putative translation factor)
VPKVKGKPLSTRFRARLYIANLAFEKERMLGQWLKTPGLLRTAKRAARLAIQERVKQAEAVIGADWAARLKRTRSYSGLSIKDLAESLKLTTSYATFYRSASWPTHATDAEMIFSAESTLDIAPSREESGKRRALHRFCCSGVSTS